MRSRARRRGADERGWFARRLDAARDQDVVREGVRTDDRPGLARGPHLHRLLGTRDRVLQTCHDTARLDTRRVVVNRQDERVLERLLDGTLLLTLRRRVVTRRLWLEFENLVDGLDDLVLNVVDDVAADAGCPLGGLDENIHRFLGMAARRLAADAWSDF